MQIREHSDTTLPKKKIMVRINDSRVKAGYRWMHLCYVPQYIYDAYFKDKRRTLTELQAMMMVWSKEDFNFSLDLTRKSNIKKFRNFIDDAYRRTYTKVLPRDGFTFSRSGWISLWLTKHMEMELDEERAQGGLNDGYRSVT